MLVDQFPSNRINIELLFSTWNSIISTTKLCQNSTGQPVLNCNELSSFLFVVIAFNLLTRVSRAFSNKRSKLQKICICFRIHLRMISLFSNIKSLRFCVAAVNTKVVNVWLFVLPLKFTRYISEPMMRSPFKKTLSKFI